MKMKRTSIICIVVLLLSAAGSLLIYRNYLQVEADIVADFNRHQLAMASLIGREAEIVVESVKCEMTIAADTINSELPPLS